MNDDILKGQWRQVQGNIRENFGKLTDDDMEQVNGNLQTLMGKIQERYGYTKEQASQEWDRFWNVANAKANEAADKLNNRF
jgi:uncharacterized protein YjbJ (UPF0337 family)